MKRKLLVLTVLPFVLSLSGCNDMAEDPTYEGDFEGRDITEKVTIQNEIEVTEKIDVSAVR